MSENARMKVMPKTIPFFILKIEFKVKKAGAGTKPTPNYLVGLMLIFKIVSFCIQIKYSKLR